MGGRHTPVPHQFDAHGLKTTSFSLRTSYTPAQPGIPLTGSLLNPACLTQPHHLAPPVFTRSLHCLAGADLELADDPSLSRTKEYGRSSSNNNAGSCFRCRLLAHSSRCKASCTGSVMPIATNTTYSQPPHFSTRISLNKTK